MGIFTVIVARITRELGLVTYPDVRVSVCSVPLHMLTGWLSSVYVMDGLGWRQEKGAESPLEGE
jgi:hypothetical protein